MDEEINILGFSRADVAVRDSSLSLTRACEQRMFGSSFKVERRVLHPGAIKKMKFAIQIR